MNPTTIPEWVEYITLIPEDELINQAAAMGNQKFIDTLMDEGYSASDISKIHTAVALRFQKTGRRIPLEFEDCVVNYFALANPIF